MCLEIHIIIYTLYFTQGYRLLKAMVTSPIDTHTHKHTLVAVTIIKVPCAHQETQILKQTFTGLVELFKVIKITCPAIT